jgi:hypothetical protein
MFLSLLLVKSESISNLLIINLFLLIKRVAQLSLATTPLILACAQSSRILDINFFFDSHFISSKSIIKILLHAFHFIKIINLRSSKSYYTTSSTSTFYLIMIVSISIFINFKIVRYLLLHWRSNAIAAEVHCCVVIVYRVQINLFVYEQFIRFKFHLKDSSHRICKSVENVLIRYLEDQFWTQQSEIIWFLWEKCNIYVHRFIVFKLLKRREWNNKSARRIEFQNEKLRQHWIADLLNLTAKQLIFVNEFLFNEIIDWRFRAYALIDQSARYRVNIIRNRVWSVLSVYTSKNKWFISSQFYA